ncbi:ABC transporter substrate-binding protein [Gottschalkiaceae bacterium SANA]|nr:ABC transporter substrate-binding protein [Gottschalkiaceae bacterium SANA]
MKNQKKIWMIGLLFFILLLTNGCDKKPIQIGVLGSLTSKQSQLSIDARNAIQIGVDFTNQEGGIHGRPIELLVKDDEASTEVSQKRYQEFIEEDVHLILGHMTSNMSDAVLEAEELPILFLSPSMSVNTLSGIDDNFMRTSPQTNGQAALFIEFVEERGFHNVVVLYDLMNQDYTEYLATQIQMHGEKRENVDFHLVPIDSRVDDLGEVVEQLDLEGTDCVFMISQATDTAFLSQKIRKINQEAELVSVSWSMTQDLIYFGGEAVEGMYFIGVYQAEDKSKEYVRFQNAFEERFNYKPSFVSILAFDAYNVIAEGLKRAESSSPTAVKAAILEISEFQGLEEKFRVDEFGDCERSYQINQLQDKQFVLFQ